MDNRVNKNTIEFDGEWSEEEKTEITDIILRHDYPFCVHPMYSTWFLLRFDDNGIHWNRETWDLISTPSTFSDYKEFILVFKNYYKE